MREAFFILIVMAVLVGLTAIRYRKQIAAMMHIWRSLKSMREQVSQKQVRPEKAERLGPLVNCAKCGTWIPKKRAIKLRGGTFYCSSNCLETAAKTSG